MSREMRRHEIHLNVEAVKDFDLTHLPVKAAFRTGSFARTFVEFWAEYDFELAPVRRRLAVLATGEPIPDDATYITTTERHEGLVWHLYELPLEGD